MDFLKTSSYLAFILIFVSSRPDSDGGETDSTILQKKFISKNFLITSNTAHVAHVTHTCTKINVSCDFQAK